ncbi:WD40-repeat-containing domain protein [Scenedesmus sp. NREL 46B-D3]|nr:WD40-repeat-containing domain protein [Scenedesmus sp. NREL 46B-D3]
MDPELEMFVRIPPQHLELQHTAQLEDACTCMALSSDAQLLAAGSCEPDIAVFDLNLTLLRTLSGHKGGTNGLAFAKGGRLVSAGEDGHLAVWQSSSGSCLARLECEGTNVDKTPDGHTVSHVRTNIAGTMAACAAGRTLHVIDVSGDDFESNRRVFPPVAAGVIEDIKFVGDDTVLVAYYGGVCVFSTEAGASGMVLEYGTNVLAVAATPQLKYVVGGCMDSCVHIWKFEQPEKQAADNGGEGGAEDDDEDEEEGTKLIEYSCGGYMTKVSAVDFNLAGTHMASLGGTQNTVWDFTGQDGPGGSVPVVALGHSKNCTCQAWQPLPEGMPKFCAPIAVAPEPRPDEATALIWSPVHGACTIYAAHTSGTVRSWRLPATEQQQKQPQDVEGRCILPQTLEDP